MNFWLFSFSPYLLAIFSVFFPDCFSISLNYSNQYFVDNELFDFYFCVAQNIAAVEVLGGSGEKIVKAKAELEESVEAYTTQIVDTSNWINDQLKEQLDNVQKNQQKLDIKLIQVLEGLTREHENLQIISTGLVNSTSVLLKKQKQLLLQVNIDS